MVVISRSEPSRSMLVVRRSLGNLASAYEGTMNAAPQPVDEYIQSFPSATRKVLESVRATVLASVPGGEERLSYRMPAVFFNGVVVYYAAFKKHLGLFPPVQDPRSTGHGRPVRRAQGQSPVPARGAHPVGACRSSSPGPPCSQHGQGAQEWLGRAQAIKVRRQRCGRRLTPRSTPDPLRQAL